MPGGGRASTVDVVVAPQIQKKVILVLFQVFDLSSVVITVLHGASIRVRWGLFGLQYIYRIGRAGWLNSPFKS